MSLRQRSNLKTRVAVARVRLRRINRPIVLAATALTVASAVCLASSARVTLVPKFNAGETLVYEIETQTVTAGKTVTPITNGEGPTQSSLSIGMRERLEVLSVNSDPAGQSVNFRLTWDESHADYVSDALDPTAPDPSAPFALLQGQSMDFTLSPDGAISNFKGLENILPGGVPPAEAVAWISALTAARQFPHGGLSVGQQWKAERPITGAPLAGLFWQTQSTYDRNEPCPPLNSGVADESRPPAQAPHQCAIIVSQMAVARHGSPRSDQTPEDYLHNGLRTAGTWTGSGQELGSIAVETGLLISATETTTQAMDYEIKSATSGSSVRYTAKMQSQTGITLVDISQGPANGGR